MRNRKVKLRNRRIKPAKLVIRVWYVVVENEPYSLAEVDGKILVMAKPHEDAKAFWREVVAESPVAVSVVETMGPAGLASTDPHWDGRRTFQCRNPKCSCFGKVRGIDDHVARVLISKSFDE